jgi:hypothetical protein
MRDSCLLCVRKHLAKALVLASECRLGYPHHRDLVIGNMSEAEDEAVKAHPELAAAIRTERLRYERDRSYCPKLQMLLGQVRKQMPAGMGGIMPDTPQGKLAVLSVGLVAVYWLWRQST